MTSGQGVVGRRRSTTLAAAIVVAVLVFAAGPPLSGGQHVATPETFEEKFEQLQPGDTLLLEDGHYEGGILIEDRHGEPDAPITIMAKNERRAFVQADGTEHALAIVNSSHWHVEGLRLENQDNEDHADTSDAGVIGISGSHNIVVRRNLCAWPNRWGNNTGIGLSGGTTRSLIEENELINFHRNGISIHQDWEAEESTQHNIIRRNYVNSRGVDYHGQRWGPNDGVVMYRGEHNIVENNVVEFPGDEGGAFAAWGRNNQFIGNIAINGRYGYAIVQGYRTSSGHADGTVVRHNLSFNADGSGFFTHSVRDVQFINNTADGSTGAGMNVTNERGELREEEDFQPSVAVSHMLITGAGGHGYQVSDREDFAELRLEHLYGWNNEDGTWGPGTDDAENFREVNPEFASAPVFLPENSPLQGEGDAGIGATIVYRYVDGQLTEEPLWDPETGAFPHGAVIEGVNDTEDSSVYNVHERLGVLPEELPY